MSPIERLSKLWGRKFPTPRMPSRQPAGTKGSYFYGITLAALVEKLVGVIGEASVDDIPEIFHLLVAAGLQTRDTSFLPFLPRGVVCRSRKKKVGLLNKIILMLTSCPQAASSPSPSCKLVPTL